MKALQSKLAESIVEAFPQYTDRLAVDRAEILTIQCPASDLGTLIVSVDALGAAIGLGGVTFRFSVLKDEAEGVKTAAREATRCLRDILGDRVVFWRSIHPDGVDGVGAYRPLDPQRDGWPAGPAVRYVWSGRITPEPQRRNWLLGPSRERQLVQRLIEILIVLLIMGLLATIISINNRNIRRMRLPVDRAPANPRLEPTGAQPARLDPAAMGAGGSTATR